MTKTVGAIILAAGFSSRFGSVKLNAKLANGMSVVQQTLANIHYAGLPSVVITRPELAAQLQLHNTSIETFTGAAEGMGASLAFGVSKALDWDACLVCLADMPFIESSTYRLIADRLSPATIVLPCYYTRPGNPVGFGRNFYAQLQALQGDTGGRAITESNQDAVVELAIDDPAILNDIDTPADLARYQLQE
ncbi:MAG: nucleotidyltransferase family protein [Gammaproteobacteria bacterium]|nr:nucleotidyltransferase family protein [Gammaproteobacteria bacterium]